MIARRRAALLPRCYVAYASSSDKRMTASNWTTLLTVSGVFEAERVKVLKADLIFSVLSRDGALGYRAFRQALRQVAVTLYPELSEGDAFRRGGRPAARDARVRSRGAGRGAARGFVSFLVL